MLLGEYEHTLDAKGRLAMPAKLRESLGSKFIITKGLDGCLFCLRYGAMASVGTEAGSLADEPQNSA